MADRTRKHCDAPTWCEYLREQDGAICGCELAYESKQCGAKHFTCPSGIRFDFRTLAERRAESPDMI